jgi:pimeloyl-ACP methyl ester carboxylesterase
VQSPMDGPASWHASMVLDDGRTLGYATFGDPQGQPVLGFHGTPGSRLMLAICDEPARRRGVRLIAPDRPGFGLSDPLPARCYCDFADDVAALADHLGVARFPVAGVSGGGPYALACGARIPGRISRALMVSGVGPVRGPDATPSLARRHRLIFGIGARAPGLLRIVTRLIGRTWRENPDRAFDRIVAMNPPMDRAIMSRLEVRAVLVAALRDAFRHGGEPAATEIALFGRPWGFRLADVRIPVRLWHGEADRLVPAEMGRHMAASLPNCDPTFIPGAGHYWVFDHVDAMMAATVEPLGSR